MLVKLQRWKQVIYLTLLAYFSREMRNLRFSQSVNELLGCNVYMLSVYFSGLEVMRVGGN